MARDVAAHALMNVTDADVFLGAVRTTKCTKKKGNGKRNHGYVLALRFREPLRIFFFPESRTGGRKPPPWRATAAT